MNNFHPIKVPNFVPSAQVSDLVNNEMYDDSFFHPNLGGVTKGGMSNHYPMTMMSLAGLGASDTEIKRFSQAWPRYRTDIETQLHLVDSQEVTLQNWQEYLGQPKRLLEFRRVFGQAVLKLGVTAFVSEALDTLKLGLPMGLFHPLIQLSFAVIHADTQLIANALAYFAIRYENLYGQYPQLLLSNTEIPAGTQWANVSRGKPLKVSFNPVGGSLNICEQLCGESQIQQLAFNSGFVINRQNLVEKITQISQMAIKLYLSQPALTTLHAVTSCQALADLTLRLGGDNSQSEIYVKLWSLYWIWLTGLYIEKGATNALPSVKLGNKGFDSWEIMAEKARNIQEVHLIKMVYSCKWLYENIDDNELYRLACMNILVEKNAHPREIRWSELEPLE
ncbi:MAG: DUF4243 domain-containing protein [Oceanospirillaceae bacterium]|nr:DUF4243 domain-containing protein [Oceanospirillaceae bacterium]